MAGERIDYSIERQRHERFVGREALLDQLDELLIADSTDRWVVVTGGPGMGKSALLTKWLARREQAGAVVPHHFIRRGQYDWDDPAKLVSSLVAQLEERHPDVRETEANARIHPAARLVAMLRVAALAPSPPGQRLVLLIDGLDEYDPTEGGLDPLAEFLPHALPRGVSFLCASRPRHPYLDRLLERDGELTQIDLDDQGFAADNEATVRAFWESAAPGLGLDARFVNEAIARASGNLQHAAMLRKQLASMPAAQRRALDIPRGLAALLAKLWERIAVEPSAVIGLGILCAAREALTLHELGAVAGWTDEAQRRAFVRGARELLVETQRTDDVPEYRLHHDSIRAHITSAIGADVLRAHHDALAQKLATWPLPADAAARRYALQHALFHRAEAGAWADAWRVAADMGFVEAKCRELGAHDAEADIARVAERYPTSGDELLRRQFDDLAQAIRRESHWLRTTPEATAALVWNRLRRLGWSADEVDQQLRLPAEACFLRLRHLATRESPRLVREFIGHTGNVRTCMVTPDGKRVVSGSADGTLKVWSLETGRAVLSLEGHVGWVLACAVTPDGRCVVSGADDSTLKVWSLKTGRAVLSLEGHAGRVLACAVTPDGKRVVSGSEDGTLKVWSLETGQAVLSLEGHAGRVLACAVTPDGKRVVSGSEDGTLKVWDLETGQEEASLEGHSAGVTSCAVTPDGRCVISGSFDRTLKVWDLETGQEEASLEGHVTWVLTCAVTPDGRHAVSGSFDRTLKVWDLASRQTAEASLESHYARITAFAMTPDGRCLVSGSEDNTLKAWDVDMGHATASMQGHVHWTRACAVTPDGRRAVSGAWDGSLQVMNLATGQTTAYWNAHTDAVNTCTVTPDGRRMVSGANDFTIQVRDLATGRVVAILDGHTGSVNACAITPNGLVVSGSEDRTIKVWDLETGHVVATLKGHTGSVNACAVTPDGQRIVSGASDWMLKVWDLETGRPMALLQGHSARVLACTVTPDGRYVVSGSEDKTVKVWDLETGSCLLTHHGSAANTAVAATTTSIIAGDSSGAVWFFKWSPPDLHKRVSRTRSGHEHLVRSDTNPNKLALSMGTRGSMVNTSSEISTYSVFVIHADVPAETAFVRSELVPALQLKPERVLLSSELPLGQTIVGALEQGVVSSGVTILVLTPTFLRDTWASFGEALASYIAVAGGTLVPLLLADCQLPPRLNMRVQLDCRDRSKRPDALRRLRALVASNLPRKEDTTNADPGGTNMDVSLPAQQSRPIAISTTPPKVDIGILTIREDEFRAVLDVFSSKAGIFKGAKTSREYTLRHADAGHGERYTVAALCQVEQGNGEAQNAARDLIEDLAPALILVVGIAGAVPSDEVKLGDVVLSTRIHDFTVEARDFDSDPTYSTAGGPIAKMLATAIANLPAREDELGDWSAALPAQPAVVWTLEGQVYGSTEWQNKLRAKLEHHYSGGSTPRAPIYISGPIASSDRLVKDPAVLIPWLQTTRKLLAVEMESGGVYRAAQERCPMLAIRGISDIVGLKRADAWTKYACASAAAFARAFLLTRPVPVSDPS